MLSRHPDYNNAVPICLQLMAGHTLHPPQPRTAGSELCSVTTHNGVYDRPTQYDKASEQAFPHANMVHRMRQHLILRMHNSWAPPRPGGAQRPLSSPAMPAVSAQDCSAETEVTNERLASSSAPLLAFSPSRLMPCPNALGDQRRH